jgi:hypothetical protein
MSVHMEITCPSSGNFLSAHTDYELSALTLAMTFCSPSNVQLC